MLTKELSKFGSIREIRRPKNEGATENICGQAQKKQKNPRFVEFWDLRDAKEAHNAIKRQDVLGWKIPVEFSRAGGFRKSSPAMEHRIPTVARVPKRMNTLRIDMCGVS
jgi:hypothetical protein